MSHAKLFSSIVHSTVWREEKHTKVVWITMLALADKLGFVAASVPGLADAARVNVEECREALARLSAPDPDSRTKDFEGRRIAEVDGGWIVLNYVKYKGLKDVDEIRVKTRERVKRFRDKEKRRNADVTDVTLCNAVKRSVTQGNGEKRAVTDPLPPSLPFSPPYNPSLIPTQPPSPLTGENANAIPPSLDTPDFRAAWEQWHKHRREIKKPLKPQAIREQLAELEKWGLDRALAAIKNSIAGSYQGIFERKDHGNFDRKPISKPEPNHRPKPTRPLPIITGD